MSRRRIAILVAAVLILLLAGGYVYAGATIYDELTIVAAHCGGANTGNTPASFTAPGVDATPYAMPEYQTVSFPSRDRSITISGWWVPAASGAPAVIVVHGLGGCKRGPEVLLPAGMLHRNGVSVLLIDPREHGDSTVDDGRYSGGIKEYRDVLGAWDWLQSAQHVAAPKIGLLGMSLGAATVMIAMGEEPRVAATWEDSGFADSDVAISDELARNGYPTWLAFGGILAGRLFHGVDITSLSPLQAAAKLHGRPVYIVHGTADTRLPVKHAYTLAAAIRAAGGTVEPWILPGVGHVQAVFTQPAQYERRLVQFFGASLGLPAAGTSSLLGPSRLAA